MSEIDYQAVLEDLERKRDELDAAINGIRAVMGIQGTPGIRLAAQECSSRNAGWNRQAAATPQAQIKLTHYLPGPYPNR